MAHNSLKELTGISPGLTSHLRSELDWAAEGTTPPPTTWVYFMNGMGPYLEQVKIAMPIPISGAFTMPTLALPKLQFTEGMLESLHIQMDGGKHETMLLADTAAISAAQFKERLLKVSMESWERTPRNLATE